MTNTRAPYPRGTVARYLGPDAASIGKYVQVESYDSQGDRYTAVQLVGRHHGELLQRVPPSMLRAHQDLTTITRQDEIAARLWMSGTPDEWLPDTSRFDLVVTCYRGAPPAAETGELRCHFKDVPLIPPRTKALIRHAVDTTLQEWAAGSNVLVRCRGGMNRSGLITGLVLVRAGWSGDEAVDLIRARRWHHCLRNPVFRHYVRKGL